MKTTWNKIPKKKRKKKTLDKKLDVLWSAKIKKNANYRCEKCGSTTRQLHSHHLVGRRNKRTRWLEENGICLCAWCHKLAPDSAHEDTEEFREWILTSHRGKDYIYANKIKKEIKPTQTQKELMLVSLKEEPVDELDRILKL